MVNKFPFLLFLFCSNLVFPFQENSAPSVAIITPSENVKLEWNSIIPYSIAVSDKEDGNSEYDEINSNEVVLSVTFIPNSNKAANYVEQEIAERSEALSLLASSNCFTCHSAKSRLIGPSFEEIAKRYDSTSTNLEYLAQKIKKGSTGVWGDEIMPGQPEIGAIEVTQILKWISKNAQDPNFTFYSGTEGSFKTALSPKETGTEGNYVIHALYSDHGLSDSKGNTKKGHHTIVLNIE